MVDNPTSVHIFIFFEAMSCCYLQIWKEFGRFARPLERFL